MRPFTEQSRPHRPGPRATWCRRHGPIGLAAALVLVLPAAPAIADGRGGLVQRETYETHYDSGPDTPEPFWEEECAGARVREAGDITITESVFADGTLMARIDEQYRWHDVDTGELLLTQKDREVLIERPVSEVVDAQAGTRTVVLEVDYAGVPLRLLRPAGGVTLMSAGLLERTITLVLDVHTDAVVSRTVEVTRVAGPHPFLAASGDLDLDGLVDLMCAELTA